jgi:hypothetical protein
MGMMQAVFIGSVLATALMAGAGWAGSIRTQCIEYNKPEELFAASEAVFAGTVQRTRATGAQGEHVTVQVATLRVDRSWKGTPMPEIDVGVDAPLQQGRSYLVFASDQPLQTTTLCRWTEPLEHATTKLEWLARRMQIDHLVYGTTDLSRGVSEIERLLGVAATPGGQHPGGGTRNALVSLGPGSYLEIIGPDPDQPRPAEPRVFGLDALDSSRLVTWAAKGTALNQLHAQARRQGVPLGAVESGSRRRPDGTTLSWQFTDPSEVVADGIVPFFIDWGTSPHPATSAATGASLVSLRAEHPDPPQVERMLRILGLDLAVKPGPRPALIAVIDSPRGRVELR